MENYNGPLEVVDIIQPLKLKKALKKIRTSITGPLLGYRNLLKKKIK